MGYFKQIREAITIRYRCACNQLQIKVLLETAKVGDNKGTENELHSAGIDETVGIGHES